MKGHRGGNTAIVPCLLNLPQNKDSLKSETTWKHWRCVSEEMLASLESSALIKHLLCFSCDSCVILSTWVLHRPPAHVWKFLPCRLQMPQGTNSTMCVGQAKHYQLCQQQVRTTSSPDWSSLGGVGLGGSHLELQNHQRSGWDWSLRGWRQGI